MNFHQAHSLPCEGSDLRCLLSTRTCWYVIIYVDLMSDSDYFLARHPKMENYIAKEKIYLSRSLLQRYLPDLSKSWRPLSSCLLFFNCLYCSVRSQLGNLWMGKCWVLAFGFRLVIVNKFFCLYTISFPCLSLSLNLITWILFSWKFMTENWKFWFYFCNVYCEVTEIIYGFLVHFSYASI